tara:strand:+ start:2084 stop:2341 length:258 start_codon:yes stop_codon:yes gene_type:complete
METLSTIIFLLFAISFFAIAETVYWFSKKQYLYAKAKYLRGLINQKNDLNNPDHSFYSCVYENWSSKEMNLSKAHRLCTVPTTIN